MTAEKADVALILEGTYPYVAGGVSSWVHQILCACPDRRFALLHIGPHPKAYGKKLYELPANVTELAEIHCSGTAGMVPRIRGRRGPSRLLAAFRRLHLSDEVDDQLIDDLSSGDLDLDELVHGDQTFAVVRELYQRTCLEASFMDFFWHFRAMHIPLLRLLCAPVPKAAAYHAVSTGYAGVVGAVASHREKRPLVVTEHGLYARERELELARAPWIRDVGGGVLGATRPSPLRRLWSHYFRMLSRIAYHQATQLVTLSECNRRKQLADGADPRKSSIVPNGVEPREIPPAPMRAEGRPFRIGFVGRVVPVKDVITLVRACGLAREQIDLEVWIVGPEKEDPIYAKRCHDLVKALGLEAHIRFMGPQPVTEIYPQLDVLLLTSLSEGQPLVILEAYAAGLPVVATDVGACRELIEGAEESDRALGPSGIVTRVANPADTAAALVRMAKHPEQRAAMGRAGTARLVARYQLRDVVATYDGIYHTMVTS